nr:MAG TPA: hypothetical protein [Caudoviricetes sp.]
MRRGTTPTIKLIVDGLSKLELRTAVLTIKQRAVVIERTLDQMTIKTDSLAVTLTQKDTLALMPGIDAEVQLRCLTLSGTAYASDVLQLPVEKILKDGELI